MNLDEMLVQMKEAVAKAEKYQRLETTFKKLTTKTPLEVLKLVTQHGLPGEPVNVEYNRKVKIPQFVVDFIDEFPKQSGHFISDILNDLLSEPDGLDRRVYEWINIDQQKNEELLTLAWITDDYEVEEEPKYYIKVGDKLYFKNWGEDGTCPVFEIDDAPGGVTGITGVDLQEAEMTAGIIGGTVEEVNHG